MILLDPHLQSGGSCDGKSFIPLSWHSFPSRFSQRNQVHIVYSVCILCFKIYSAFLGVLCAQAVLLPQLCPHSPHTTLSQDRVVALFIGSEAADVSFTSVLFDCLMWKNIREIRYKSSKCLAKSLILPSTWHSRSGRLSWWPRSRGK